jgi:magnesium chelatase family protein
MRDQVIAALKFAKKCGRDGYNSDLDEKQMAKYCALGKEEKAFMSKAYSSFAMSPRSYVRALKVSRTIADLDASEEIKIKHLAEALNYRLQE